MSFSHTVLLVAMRAEAEPLIGELRLKKSRSPWAPHLPMKLFQGKRGRSKISLVLFGKDADHGIDVIGTQAATIAATIALDKLKPSLLLNAGTAGGMQQFGAQIGDVYLATKAIYHDRRIPIPGFDHYGRGNYDLKKGHVLVKKTALKKGTVSTGNSLDYVTRDLEIIQEHEAVMKDMEAAAIAWVARLYKVPLIVIKSITDIVDGGRPTHEEFLENLATASQNLQKKVVEILSEITH